jgi:hypothetical protein
MARRWIRRIRKIVNCQRNDIPGNQTLTPSAGKGDLESQRRLSNALPMNKVFRLSQLTPYEADYARWCAEQGALLRDGRLDALDRENLAEEIESLGRSDRREIESSLKVLLAHLLKWHYQPEGRNGSWRATIRDQRRGIAKVVKESPSLRTHTVKALKDEYAYAVSDAIDETGMPEHAFPAACPFTIEQILDVNWLPEA